MEIVISPREAKETHISSYVAKIHKYMKTQKLPYQLHDMGTNTARELM